MEEYLQVGVITAPHGVHGEVRVYPTTDDAKRFSKLKECILETKKGRETVHIRSVKYQKNMVILGFKEFATMNDVETLRQCPLYVDRKHAVKLEKDEYFIADLIGLKVISDVVDSEGEAINGELTDVIQTGANDVYEITLEDGRVFLLPAIADCVLDVNIKKGTITIHVLPGLIDEPVKA